MQGFKTYEELRNIDKKYDSTFNLWEGKKYKSNILKYKKDYDGYHPTQKPVLLLEDLIKTFSNEGDLVVDLTMGSGSTGVACKNTNRSFIGIEKDENYFKIAEQRINARTLFS
jgi:site-specific DNA-methyltransferase (adenine-specific)